MCKVGNEVGLNKIIPIPDRSGVSQKNSYVELYKTMNMDLR